MDLRETLNLPDPSFTIPMKADLPRLEPTIQAKWSGAPASNFATSVAEALPNAAAWPVRMFQSITNRG